LEVLHFPLPLENPSQVPWESFDNVAPMLKPIQAKQRKKATKEKAVKVIAKLIDMRLR